MKSHDHYYAKLKVHESFRIPVPPQMVTHIDNGMGLTREGAEFLDAFFTNNILPFMKRYEADLEGAAASDGEVDGGNPGERWLANGDAGNGNDGDIEDRMTAAKAAQPNQSALPEQVVRLLERLNAETREQRRRFLEWNLAEERDGASSDIPGIEGLTAHQLQHPMPTPWELQAFREWLAHRDEFECWLKMKRTTDLIRLFAEG